jgi:hypothetical protein
VATLKRVVACAVDGTVSEATPRKALEIRATRRILDEVWELINVIEIPLHSWKM